LLGRHWLVGGHRFQFLDRPGGGKLRAIGPSNDFSGRSMTLATSITRLR